MTLLPEVTISGELTLGSRTHHTSHSNTSFSEPEFLADIENEKVNHCNRIIYF